MENTEKNQEQPVILVTEATEIKSDACKIIMKKGGDLVFVDYGIYNLEKLKLVAATIDIAIKTIEKQEQL